MKLLHKSLFVIIVLASIGHIFAFDFSNDTNKTLLLRIKPKYQGGIQQPEDNYQIVKPNNTVKLWPPDSKGISRNKMQMIICLQSIAAVIWKGTDAQYNLYVGSDGMIPDTKQREFGDTIGRRESFPNPMNIEQAGSIVGKDICTSQSLSIVDTGQKDKFTQQPMFKAVIK